MHRVLLVAFLTMIGTARARSVDSLPGREVWAIPEAMHLIRTATQVYVFPVTVTKNDRSEATPHGEFKRARLIEGTARRALRRILEREGNWFHGLDSTVGVGPEPRNVGFIFRRGGHTLVLLCYMGWRADGTFDGENTGGSLERRASDKLEEWKRKNAKQELGIK